MFKKLLALSFPFSLWAFHTEPWYSNEWEFSLTPSYTYSYYKEVQNGYPLQKGTSNDQLLCFDLAVPPSPQWEVGADVEFADTPRQVMGMRSLGFQLRYLWLDDISGDPVSLTTGASVRGVSHHSLKDVSSPYHSNVNFELSSSVGKEWDHGFEWKVRCYGFGAVGMANHGFPWVRAFTMLEANQYNTHRVGFFAEACAGFGGDDRVNIDHFNGYAAIRHRNLDLGVQYTYVFEIWGRLSFSYTRRLYAHCFPQNVNFFTVTYRLPFSLF